VQTLTKLFLLPRGNELDLKCFLVWGDPLAGGIHQPRAHALFKYSVQKRTSRKNEANNSGQREQIEDRPQTDHSWETPMVDIEGCIDEDMLESFNQIG